MNFTTPGTGLHAADALEHVARLVAGAGAAVVVDPVAGRLRAAASPAAIERLGSRVAESQASDRAMPAWMVIEAASARLVAAPATPAADRLVVGSGAAGARRDPDGDSGRRPPRRAAGVPGEAGKPGPAEAAQPATPPPPRDDTSTLQEIARRIRSGLGAAVAGSEASAATPAVAVPPPLDFRRQEFAVDAQEPGPTLTPEPTGVRRLAHELLSLVRHRVAFRNHARSAPRRHGELLLPVLRRRHSRYGAQHTLDLVRGTLSGWRSRGCCPSLGCGADAFGAAIALEPVDLGDLAQRCQSAMAPVAACARTCG